MDKTSVLGFVFGIVEEVSPQQKFHSSDMISYVFGGWVRDMVRGEPPNDIDLKVPTEKDAQNLVEMLLVKKLITNLRTTTTMDYPRASSLKYSCFSMEITTPLFHSLRIDLSYSKATSLDENSLNYCDFTANNLTINFSGNISTRIKPWQIGQSKNYTEAEWLVKCFRDCVEGKLVWMIPDRFSRKMSATDVSKSEFMEKMHMRLQKMQRKGFVLAEEKERYLTSFQLAE